MSHLMWQVLRIVQVDARQTANLCEWCLIHLGLVVLYMIDMIILKIQ